MPDSGACENCGTAVVRHGQNWTHITGSLRCPGSHWKGDGFAVLADPVDIDTATGDAYREGHADGAAEAREEIVAEILTAPLSIVHTACREALADLVGE